jgi:hypothetical protein
MFAKGEVAVFDFPAQFFNWAADGFKTVLRVGN